MGGTVCDIDDSTPRANKTFWQCELDGFFQTPNLVICFARCDPMLSANDVDVVNHLFKLSPRNTCMLVNIEGKRWIYVKELEGETE